jgi:hypothetical protein
MKDEAIRHARFGAAAEASYIQLKVGSGTVESVCKTAVQDRMKQAAPRHLCWSRESVQATLALRYLLHNRWHELRNLPSYLNFTIRGMPPCFQRSGILHESCYNVFACCAR